MRGLLVLLWWLLTGAAPSVRVAVLELRPEAEVGPSEARYLTDRVRDAALGLPPDYIVMTRENMLALLPPEAELADCEGACEVETGRNLGADYVVSGEIVRFGDELRLTLRLHETRDGRLLASESVAGERVTDLETAVTPAARRLLAAMTLRPTSPRAGAALVQPGVRLPAGETVRNVLPNDTGIVLIRSDPPGATIFVDGRHVGAAPLQLELDVGPHVLVARRPLHHDARHDILVRPIGAQVTLVLPPAYGSLHVKSRPSGASVSLDGEPAGTTPLTIQRKASGRYELRVEHPCHRPEDRTVTVRDGESTRLDIELVRTCGSLVVASRPAGARILLNGTPTEAVTPHRFDDLQPGLVTVSLHRDGFGEGVAHARILSRATSRVDVDLTPRLGLLVVMATHSTGEPCDGPLFIDGEAKGRVPWKGAVLATRHRVEVRCAEGSARGEVQVVHNAETRLDLDVEPAPRERSRSAAFEPHPSESPRPASGSRMSDGARMLAWTGGIGVAVGALALGLAAGYARDANAASTAQELEEAASAGERMRLVGLVALGAGSAVLGLSLLLPEVPVPAPMSASTPGLVFGTTF